MERDKKGRFVKKAQLGTDLSNLAAITGLSEITINGKKYKISPGASQDYISISKDYSGSYEQWLEENMQTYLEEIPEVQGSPAIKTQTSAGMNLTTQTSNTGNSLNTSNPINKTKLANFLDLAKAGVGIYTNNKIANRALEAEKPFLQDISESHRSVYGDYRAQVQGEKAAAQLRNMASKPLTSDGALQQQMMMEAQIKGQQYIDQGNAQDEAMIKQTREVAWQQEK